MTRQNVNSFDAAPARPIDPDRVDALLPQTQCRRCGFDGCRPYAEAIAAGEADINRCPPGGDPVIGRLAVVTGRPMLPLDPHRGPATARHRVVIDPTACIGCTKCIQACPVDAIIGAVKFMHAVIADECTGCDLCLPPCPVDCIESVPVGCDWTDADAVRSRERYHAREQRLAAERIRQQDRLASMAVAKLAALEREPQDPQTLRKRAIVEAAIRRARERAHDRAGSTPPESR